MELRLQYPPVPEHARHLADVCVAAAQKVSGLTLDYSEASLRSVDSQLGEFHRDHVESGEIASTLFCFGCYVGEVLVTGLGGRWVPLENSPLKQFGWSPMVVVLDSGSSWDPIAKVFKRVDEGESESVAYLYRVAAGFGGRRLG